MRVDVIDFAWIDTGTRYGRYHAAIGTVAIFGRRGNMKGVARQSVPDDFAINVCAAIECVLQLLQNDDTCTLAHDETVSVLVIRSGGFFRCIVKASRKRAAGGKAGNCQSANRRFRSTGQHHVGVAETDEARGIPDGVCAGRTSCDDSIIRALQAMTN